MKDTSYDLKDIIHHFDIPGNFAAGYPYGNGHINDTFCVESDAGTRYILQRINSNLISVSKDPLKTLHIQNWII